jgi:cell division septum initiation protein DivIVA
MVVREPKRGFVSAGTVKLENSKLRKEIDDLKKRVANLEERVNGLTMRAYRSGLT